MPRLANHNQLPILFLRMFGAYSAALVLRIRTSHDRSRHVPTLHDPQAGTPVADPTLN